MEPGTTFTEGAGTTTGTKPVIVGMARWTTTAPAASSIAIHCAAQASEWQPVRGPGAFDREHRQRERDRDRGGGFSEAGSITLTNGDSSGNSATLARSPAGRSPAAARSPSNRLTAARAHLRGNITNTGKLLINANTSYNGAKGLLINEGAIDIAEGKQLTVSTEAARSRMAPAAASWPPAAAMCFDGTGYDVHAGRGHDERLQAGDRRDGALAYTGRRRSAIAMHGSIDVERQTVGRPVAVDREHRRRERDSDGGGRFERGLDHADQRRRLGQQRKSGCHEWDAANSGTIAVEPANGGSRTLQGSITNTGSIAINANTAYSGPKHLLTNEGALTSPKASS